MAYAQWVLMIIQNKIGSGQLTVKNLKIEWGKFHQPGNKDAEISVNDAQSQVATPSKDAQIASCGRSDASSGTEGSYDIYDGDTKVCHIYWSCPWGSKTNTFTVSDIDNAYVVQATGATLDSGALGNVTIKIVKMG
ncbi:hypothetical protein N3K66_006301 [Trichothecium roseum]|uniref:Uncharacterized protein n=1 Tax=Trichothecium roseum TaxID=47278 RepID=A0ACC0UV09_9HYPO|nr:hypothetical protein N3K66_006301 [Trichothecium roseum]